MEVNLNKSTRVLEIKHSDTNGLHFKRQRCTAQIARSVNTLFYAVLELHSQLLKMHLTNHIALFFVHNTTSQGRLNIVTNNYYSVYH